MFRETYGVPRLLIGVIAFGCLALAVTWSGWSTVLAQQVYLRNTAYLGCTGERGSLKVSVLDVSTGSPVPPVELGTPCADALAAFGGLGWRIAEESQFMSEKLLKSKAGFSVFYRLSQ